MRSVALLLVLLFACSAFASEQAEVYKSVGPGGVVEFSDQPSPGARQIEISPPTTYSAPKLPPLTSKQPTASAPAAEGYRQVTIAAPPPDQAVVDTTGDVQVKVQLDPKLRQGDRLRVLVDGTPVATASDTTVALHNVFRGTHQLQVQVLDGQGQVVASSESSTFHMIRPSLNLPRR